MMTRGLGMSKAVAGLAGLVLLAGCTFGSFGVPPSDRNTDTAEDIREEEGGFITGIFTRTPADIPDAVPVPMRSAVLESGYGGTILRVTGVAPTQGYYNATLLGENDGAADEAGVVTVALLAVPPIVPEAVGPERTRLLITAAFITNLELRNVRAFRVVAGNEIVTLPVR